MIKYMIKPMWAEAKIHVVEVIRETEKCVFILDWRNKERRHDKRGQYESYYDSWDEAKDRLIKKAEARLIYAKKELQVAQSHLGNTKALKPNSSKSAAETE